MSRDDEPTLAHGCGQGDRRAFVRAIELHLPSLLRFARTQCEGELAANAILVRAIEEAGREIPRCAQAESVLVWLLGAVHRTRSSLSPPLRS